MASPHWLMRGTRAQAPLPLGYKSPSYTTSSLQLTSRIFGNMITNYTEVIASNNGSVITQPSRASVFFLICASGKARNWAPYLSIGCNLSPLVVAYMREFFYWPASMISPRIIEERLLTIVIHVRGSGWLRDIRLVDKGDTLGLLTNRTLSAYRNRTRPVSSQPQEQVGGPGLKARNTEA